MRKVAFIGGYDKSDLIIYIAKILVTAGKSVLIIDSTLMQKTRYIVPTITPAEKYVTTYDDIDIAIGFYGLQDLERYFGVGELNYDIVLGDIDSPNEYINFGFGPKDIHYFVTSFDVFSVQRGVDVLSAFTELTEIKKVLFTKNPESEEKNYLDFVTMNYNVKWSDDIIYFPFETDDLYAIYLNQRYSRVKFNNLSMGYTDCMVFLAEECSGLSTNDVKKAVKAISKE